MKPSIPFLLLLALASCQDNSGKMNYPDTQKIPIIDSYFETEVIDSYRWLEDIAGPNFTRFTLLLY